jgi:aminopeptidase N
MKRIVLLIALLGLSGSIYAQVQKDYRISTKQDSLRGMLTPLRTCYDLTYYHLDVKVDPYKKTISGSNLFKFKVVSDFRKLQFDLSSDLKIEKVVYHGQNLEYIRELNAVFVTFPEQVTAGKIDSFVVHYASGEPDLSKARPQGKALRSGGFVYAQDSNGKPWITTSCQGIGASTWWPVKEHQEDEADSILISVSVPKEFTDVSNGRLRKITNLKDGYRRFDWFVSNPISNYCVSMNIGDYVNIKDTYDGEKGKLDLSYWVLKENYDKAKTYFPNSVKLMLKSHEHWFGPYPFYEDSYKLVDAPYAGMEHQSAVTYGNNYEFGYLARDISGTGWGMKWDFIIVHESGHEWFGNNLTAKDVADMWIHESFTNYAEGLYVDSYYGKMASQQYAHGLRTDILNDRPVQGRYGVNKSGSKDMYNKGGVVLNMVRTIIDDDEKWRRILRGLGTTFYHQTVTYDQVVNYISKESGIDLNPVFEQYIKNTIIPTLELRYDKGKAYCRWISDVSNFNMPIRMRIKGGTYSFVKPITLKWTEIPISGINKENIDIDTFNFYIGVLQNETNKAPADK